MEVDDGRASQRCTDPPGLRHQEHEHRFQRQRLGRIKDLFHENLVYHGQGTSRYAQDFTGRDEFFAVERQFAERSTMHQEVQEIYADDVHAIVTVVVEAQNGDVKATWREAEVFHFDADGKVSDTWGIPMDQEVVDNFWATFAEAGIEA